jgi:hypothetical protein
VDPGVDPDTGTGKTDPGPGKTAEQIVPIIFRRAH